MKDDGLLIVDTKKDNQFTKTKSSCLASKFNPLVTIAIPTVRRPHYLREALRSAVEQTYHNLQIVVSDNGSGDTTPDVVSEFKDDRIFFRQNAATVSPVEHYRQCLSCAQGQYFMMLCDDDTISPGYVEAMVGVMEKWPEVTAAFGSSCTIDSEGTVQQSCMLDKTWREPGSRFLKDWFMHRRVFPTFSVISVFTRTDIVREYGWLPAFHAFSDVAFVVALALTGDVAFSQNGCFYYRIHPEGDCVNMPWADMPESVRAFKQYLATEPVFTLTKALPRREWEDLQYAIDYGNAYVTLARLYHYYIPQMTAFEVAKALWGYPFNAAFFLCLPRFGYWVLRRRRLPSPRREAEGVCPRKCDALSPQMSVSKTDASCKKEPSSMAPEIIHTPSYRQNARPSGSPLLNFVKNICLTFEPGSKSRYWGVPFRRHLLSFLVADLALGRLSLLDFYRYVSYSVGGTRHLETDFLYQNLRHVSGCKNYLDVSSPRVVPYFLAHYLSMESATLCNPDAADLFESQRSVGRGSKTTTFLPVRLQEIGENKKYDLITSVSVVEHVPPDQTREFINNILALLAPGGLCLLTFPCARSEIIEYRDVDPYTTQAFDEKNEAYFFQKYFTPELVEHEILPGFDEIVARKIFGEGERGQYWKYEESSATVQSYSSSQDRKIVSHMFSEFRSMGELPGVGVCCYLLKKANDGKVVQCTRFLQ